MVLVSRKRQIFGSGADGRHDETPRETGAFLISGPDSRRFPSTELVPGGYITSACSPLVYEADLFPKEFKGNVFVCDAHRLKLGFSLSSLDEAKCGLRLFAVASRQGRVEAAVSWLEGFSGRGRVLDVIRRRQDAEPGCIELLLRDCIENFANESVQWASLGMAGSAGLSPRRPIALTSSSAPRLTMASKRASIRA